MTEQKRKIEIFSAGCSLCEQVIRLIQGIACASCEVSILDIHDPLVANRARDLGIRGIPAVAIEGRLADCCTRSGPDEATLRALGVGEPLD